MTALLLLAATLAGAQMTDSDAQRAQLTGSMEHWALLARADSADPALLALSSKLQDMRNLGAQPLSDEGMAKLQRDFGAWKDELSNLLYGRRPESAPADPAVYRKQLEQGVAGIVDYAATRKTSQKVAVLGRLVDPAQLNWALERSRDRDGALGDLPRFSDWTGPNGERQSPSGAPRRLPPGWTMPSDGVSDLATAPPSDPAIVKKVAQYGDWRRRVGGTIGSCYAGVKDILEDTLKIATFDGKGVRTDEIQGAYQFPRFVERHPALLKRKLARYSTPVWPLQISDIVVWGRGVCGYNPDWGHIEMIYKISPDAKQAWAVSDHSQAFNVDCFRAEAAKVADAQTKLPSLREKAASAQASYDSLKSGSDRKAAARALRVLRAAKSAAARAEAQLDRVIAYSIERPVTRNAYAGN